LLQVRVEHEHDEQLFLSSNEKVLDFLIWSL